MWFGGSGEWCKPFYISEMLGWPKVGREEIHGYIWQFENNTNLDDAITYR
jgi:hypothetical protein